MYYPCGSDKKNDSVIVKFMEKKKLKLFEILSDEHVDWMLLNSSIKKYEQGDIILKENYHGDFIFILMQGELKVILDYDGENNVISRLSAGDVFGELSFLSGKAVTATVIAECPSNVLAIDTEMLKEKMQMDASLSTDFYKSVAIIIADKLLKANKKLSVNVADFSSQSGSGLPEDLESMLTEFKHAIVKVEAITPADITTKKSHSIQSSFDNLITEIFKKSEIKHNEYKEMSQQKKELYLDNLTAELSPCLLVSPFFEHCISNCRMFPEDEFVIKSVHIEAEQIENHVAAYITNALIKLPYYQIIKIRSEMLQALIEPILAQGSKRIVSVFNAPCFELSNINNLNELVENNSFVFIEQSNAAISSIKQALGDNVNETMMFYKTNKENAYPIKEALFMVESADLIYGLSNINYASDGQLLQQLNAYYNSLNEGGILVLGYYHADATPNKLLLDEFYNYKINYRTEEMIKQLVQTSKLKSCTLEFAKRGDNCLFICLKE